MLSFFKRKLRKSLLLACGKHDYLRTNSPVRKRWYGNEYGGFYLCPDLLNHKSIVYSFGIGEDASFDHAVMRAHGCEVFGFDPTPRSVRWVEQNRDALGAGFHFADYGIATESGNLRFYFPKNPAHVSGSLVLQSHVDEARATPVKMKTLEDITEEFGHTRLDVLKMDIEGAEFDVLHSILHAKIPIDQLLVEFHGRCFPDGHDKTRSAVRALEQHGFTIFGVSDVMEEVSFVRTAVA